MPGMKCKSLRSGTKNNTCVENNLQYFVIFVSLIANAKHCLSPQGEFARAFANKWRNKNRNTKNFQHRYYFLYRTVNYLH